ncbi:hypothetical protein H5T87_07170, partial [bacterium]|nr:hypothetical protein [bacterium]
MLDRSPLTIYDLAKRVMKILVSVYREREPLLGQIEIDEVYICNWLK